VDIGLFCAGELRKYVGTKCRGIVVANGNIILIV
jgi:hypothetical protein